MDKIKDIIARERAAKFYAEFDEAHGKSWCLYDMLASLLTDFHDVAAHAVRALRMTAGEDFQNDAERKLNKFIFPLAMYQDAEPVYDRSVLQSAKRIFPGTFPLGALTEMQSLFDAGRERGMDEEAMRLGKRTVPVDVSQKQAEDRLERAYRDMTGNGIKAREYDGQVLGQYGKVERYPRPNDEPISDLYRDPNRDPEGWPGRGR